MPHEEPTQDMSRHVQALRLMDQDRKECANPCLCLGVEHGHRQFSNTLQLIIRDKDNALILVYGTSRLPGLEKAMEGHKHS
jgi:hypothetical protein